MEYGTVSAADYEDLFFTDSVDDAVTYITNRLMTDTTAGSSNDNIVG